MMRVTENGIYYMNRAAVGKEDLKIREGVTK